jgi:alpha-tubulin suppressor-like RCC1 family protein
MPTTHSGRYPRRRQRRVLPFAVAVAVLALVSPALTIAGPAAPAGAVPLPIVAGGGGHTCAVAPDQSVWCWGQNTTGQLGNSSIADSTVPVHVTGVAQALAVAGGHDHSCAIDTGHNVWCWGANAFGQLGNGTTSVDSTTPVQAGTLQGLQVSAGDGFTCAVTAAHTARCWGDNNFGELGDGTTADSSTPKLVKGLTGVTAVAAGYFHACALLTTGRVWCWGDNGNGELGNGTTTASDVPVPTPLEAATAITAGNSDSCAITSGGDLQCWGNNNVGQLGIGNFTDAHVPAQVASLNTGVSQVGLGQDFGCALAATPGATVVCWGDAGGYGQLGTGSFNQQDPFPTTVFGLQSPPAGGPGGPAQIAVGGQHACVVLTSAKVECWGRNFTGALGDGTRLDRAIPTPTIGLPLPPHAVNQVSAGVVTSCAVTAGFGASCWGEMTGDGSPLHTNHTSAVAVKNLPAGGVSQVSTGWGGCALVRTGGLATGVRCWGDNTWGELGNGTTTDTVIPVKVSSLSNVMAVASGATHVCALIHNGGAWCWGENDKGQLGDGTTTNRSTPVIVTGLPSGLAQIAAADDHTCALLKTETVKCWGQNNKGQLGDGTTSDRSTPVAVAGLTGVVAISLGDAYTCALLDNGAVQCWGFNSFGELGNGTTTDSTSPVQVSGLTSGVQALSAGDAAACAVLISAQVDCWGDNTNGELGNGSVGGQSTTPGLVQGGGFASDGASLGLGMGATSCALDGSEMANCWGANFDAQVGDGSLTDTGSPTAVQGL